MPLYFAYGSNMDVEAMAAAAALEAGRPCRLERHRSRSCARGG